LFCAEEIEFLRICLIISDKILFFVRPSFKSGAKVEKPEPNNQEVFKVFLKKVFGGLWKGPLGPKNHGSFWYLIVYLEKQVTFV